MDETPVTPRVGPAAPFTLNLDSLRAWCDRNSVTYLFNEQLGQLGIPTPLGKDFLLRVVPRSDRGMLTLALPLPMVVPPALLHEVARATALANSGTFMGAWVLNHGRGELYFRVTVPVDGAQYEDRAVLFLMNVVIGTVRGVAPAFRRIVVDGAPAESVMQKAE